jgi:hypothetical protein
LLLAAALEVELMLRVTAPELYDAMPDEEIVGIYTVEDAIDAGLSVKLRRKRGSKRKKARRPTLPGCRGGFLTGPDHTCLNLRVRGHEFCPECEQHITPQG